jgi:hypothetical protein
MFKRALILAMIVMTAAGLVAPVLLTTAQGAVTVTPNRDYINVRLWPAIGATVVGNLGPGDVMMATGRSVDGDWVRIDFFGDEAWVGLLVVDVTGDLASLPLADPRTIPYNSNTVPSAGGGSLAGPLMGRLEDSGVALRAGPSTAYPVLQNLPRYAEFEVVGRVASSRWVQVSWEGLVGWAALDYVTLISDGMTSIEALPVVPPAADTGVRLSDANARERFLVVDSIRRQLDQARATLAVMDSAWQTIRSGVVPEVCSAPPVMETFFLNSTERNAYPDLIEAVARLNQGINDLNNAIDWYMDVCLNNPDNVTGQSIAGGPAAVQRAGEAFDDVQFRITESKAVQVMAIHAHINFAQDQFERIEAIWLDVRLGVIDVPPCVGLPQQPPDYALTAWEQTTYPELIPLVERLNEGLAVLREAIQIWDNECQQYASVRGYSMPPETGATGYNTMLQAREILNDVRGNYLVPAYGEDFIMPAPTRTPDPTIEAILHAPYTPTFTATPTPSFQYSVAASVARSALHPGTCGWFGIAGEVYGPDGSPRPAALIHVYGPGVDQHLLSGSDTRYGPAGFEVPIRAEIAQVNTFYVRIEDGFGNPLSPEQQILFADGCELNVALVTFTQSR